MARTRDKEKPAQIIEAAFAVFGDVGYEATVIKDIAEKAGISSGAIYTYFSDKRTFSARPRRRAGTGSSSRSGRSPNRRGRSVPGSTR